MTTVNIQLTPEQAQGIEQAINVNYDALSTYLVQTFIAPNYDTSSFGTMTPVVYPGGAAFNGMTACTITDITPSVFELTFSGQPEPLNTTAAIWLVDTQQPNYVTTKSVNGTAVYVVLNSTDSRIVNISSKSLATTALSMSTAGQLAGVSNITANTDLIRQVSGAVAEALTQITEVAPQFTVDVIGTKTGEFSFAIVYTGTVGTAYGAYNVISFLYDIASNAASFIQVGNPPSTVTATTV